MKLPLAASAVSLLGLLGLSVVVVGQSRRLSELEERVANAPRAEAPARGGASTSRTARVTGDGAGAARRPSALETPVAVAAAVAELRATQAARGREVGEGAEEVIGALLEGGEPGQRFRSLVRQEMDAARDDARTEREQRREERLKERVQKLAEEAKLSDKQVTGLQSSLVLERAQVRDSFRAARRGELPFDEAREQIEALRSATDESVRGLLSGDQYAAYEAMREEETARWRGGAGRRGAAAR